MRQAGYGHSINSRKRRVKVFGWINKTAVLRQLSARGRTLIGVVVRLPMVAYNLIRQANLLYPLKTGGMKWEDPRQ